MVLYITVSNKNFYYIRITCRKFWRNFRIVMYCDDDGTVCFSMTFSTLELRIRMLKILEKLKMTVSYRSVVFLFHTIFVRG